MVTVTDSTQIVTTPNVQEHAQPSFKRWLKHSFYFQYTRRYFKPVDLQKIAAAVQQAECGHVGEIQVVVEGHLPCLQAYKQNTRKRAEQLFSELGVWDTEYNSGVLLYLNLCERQVELIFDRGLHQVIKQEVWNVICQDIVQQFSQRQYVEAVIQAILKIGELLQQFYVEQGIEQKNELPNAPIIFN
ncbi:TPM domain-containing protein [Acinetobacter sp. NigerLNRRAM0016]